MDLLDYYDENGLPFVVNPPTQNQDVSSGTSGGSVTLGAEPLIPDQGLQYLTPACHQSQGSFIDVNSQQISSTYNQLSSHQTSAPKTTHNKYSTSVGTCTLSQKPIDRQHYQRLNSADAKLEDFFNGLADSSSDIALTSSNISLLSDEDPQSQELKLVLQQLEKSTCSIPGKQLNTQGDSVVPLDTYSDPVIQPSVSQPQDKVKLHPTLTHILIHGAEKEDMYGPITPLKDKTCRSPGDLDNSLRFVEQLQKSEGIRSSVSPLSLLPGPPANLIKQEPVSSDTSDTLYQSSHQLFDNPPSVSDSSVCSSTVLSSPDSRLTMQKGFEKPWSDGENLADRTMRAAIKAGNHGNQCSDSSTLKDLEAKNKSLQDENNSLKQEVAHLQNVLLNQSTIANYLKKVPDVTSVTLTKHKASSLPDHSPTKKSRLDNDDGVSSAVEQIGLCIHIRPGNPVASIQRCAHCSKISEEKS